MRISDQGMNFTGDIKTFLDEVESSFFNLSSQTRTNFVVTLKDSLKENLKNMEKGKRNEGEILGFTTGFPSVDKKLLGMQEGGAVQDSAMMQQEQPSPFVPFDQRPNQAPATGNWGQSGDYMNSLRGELEMENEELTRDKMENFLERLRLDSLSEKIERSPQDSMYYRNTPQQDYFMDKYREEMINPNYFPEGN